LHKLLNDPNVCDYRLPTASSVTGQGQAQSSIVFLKEGMMHLLKSIELILLQSWSLVFRVWRSSKSISPQLAALQQIQTKKPDPNVQLLTQANQATLSGYKDYKVGPEDLLTVGFFGQDDLNREVRVNGQGEVSLPLTGALPAGLSQEVRATGSGL
jgi:hypothetical protein